VMKKMVFYQKKCINASRPAGGHQKRGSRWSGKPCKKERKTSSNRVTGWKRGGEKGGRLPHVKSKEQKRKRTKD